MLDTVFKYIYKNIKKKKWEISTYRHAHTHKKKNSPMLRIEKKKT